MSNPYQTCPSQFYQQFRALRAAQQQNQMVVPPQPIQNIQSVQPVTQQRTTRKPSQNPNPSRTRYVSQTLNTKDYQRMAKQAQMYQNNPRQIPVQQQQITTIPQMPQMQQQNIQQQMRRQTQNSANTALQNQMNQVIFEQNPYVTQRQTTQRRDAGRLQEIRNQIEALNAEVADICMRQELEENYDENRCFDNRRMGAIAPNPLSMKYGRMHSNKIQNSFYPMNDRYNRFNQNHQSHMNRMPMRNGRVEYFDTFSSVNEFDGNEFGESFDPYEIDNEFFSPSMSPNHFDQFENTQMNQFGNDEFSEFYDDWENDYSVMQPIQMTNVQTMRPSAVRQVQPVFIQDVQQPQFVPRNVNNMNQMNNMNGMNNFRQMTNVQSVPTMNGMQTTVTSSVQPIVGGYTNPYRQKKQNQMNRKQQPVMQQVVQPVMQPVMQSVPRQQMMFKPSQQWQPVNSQFDYYE